MIPLTPEQRSRLPLNVARAPVPPAIQDRPAFIVLKSILEKAVMELSALMTDPIVIGASPNRFNDIYWSDWRAIRFGPFFTERHEYGHMTGFDYERDLANGPSGAREARRVLDELEAVNWRTLFSDAFAIGWADQALALALQDSLPWLVFSASCHTDENHVFALWDDQPLAYFGECIERFDWEMQESPPLRFQELKS